MTMFLKIARGIFLLAILLVSFTLYNNAHAQRSLLNEFAPPFPPPVNEAGKVKLFDRSKYYNVVNNGTDYQSGKKLYHIEFSYGNCVDLDGKPLGSCHLNFRIENGVVTWSDVSLHGIWNGVNLKLIPRSEIENATKALIQWKTG